MATLGSGLGRLQPAAARQRQDAAADGHSLGGDTFRLGWLGDGARRGMELGAQRVGGDKQREWMGQGLATAAMGAPAMSLAAERRRKMERAGGRMEDALLSKTRRARRGGAHATREASIDEPRSLRCPKSVGHGIPLLVRFQSLKPRIEIPPQKCD